MLNANTEQGLNNNKPIYTTKKLKMVLTLTSLLVAFVIIAMALFIENYVSIPIGTATDEYGHTFIEDYETHNRIITNTKVWFYLWLTLSKPLVGTTLVITTATIPQKINKDKSLMVYAILSYFLSIVMPIKWMNDFYKKIKEAQKPLESVFDTELNNKNINLDNNKPTIDKNKETREKNLQKLESLRKRGLIDDEDYQRIKKDIMKDE